MVWTQDYTIVLCGLYAFPVCVCVGACTLPTEVVL